MVNGLYSLLAFFIGIGYLYCNTIVFTLTVASPEVRLEIAAAAAANADLSDNIQTDPDNLRTLAEYTVLNNIQLRLGKGQSIEYINLADKS